MISADLTATSSQYSWVGTSYLLSQTVITPFTGRFTDMVGRKPALLTAIVVMGVFSAVCGYSTSIEAYIGTTLRLVFLLTAG